MFSHADRLTDGEAVLIYGSLSSTLNFFNLMGWIQNFMGQVGNLIRHVGDVMGQIGNHLGQVGDPIGQDLTCMGLTFKI